ncbi:MAG TPA: phosphohistidine phosphatase SixA, partial [Leptospiraceae bacterium]|nr:phosphohistidine phosphatase SixA [Leptospiraceae bacterium]
PYKRTTETAEIFASKLSFQGTPIPADELLPSNNYSEILTHFSKFTNSDTVLIIGHNPDVSFFASRLIKDESIARSFVFSTGTTIAINTPKENFAYGQLIWMISPDFLKT